MRCPTRYRLRTLPLPRRKQRTRDMHAISLTVPNNKILNRLPSAFTGTALNTSPPLTMDFSKSSSVTALPFCQTSLMVRLSSSEMRPPVETPSMNSPRLRASNVPSKQAETSRISLLSSGLVPFMVCSLIYLLRDRAINTAPHLS